MRIATHLSSYQYHIYFIVVQSAEPIAGPLWVLRQFRHHAGIAPCLDDPAFPAEMRFDVLQASRSSLETLVERVCQRRWIGSASPDTILDAGPNVCSHLPLGSQDKPVRTRIHAV